jgi:hypothetical protein
LSQVESICIELSTNIYLVLLIKYQLFITNKNIIITHKLTILNNK